ncbi:MAG: transposase [Candidatus Binataceae bacterium]
MTWRVAPDQKTLSPEERTTVFDAIKHFDRERYDLEAFVVMDDHVYVIVYPGENQTLESIVASWKSFSSHLIQRSRKLAGPLWQDEYFDRVIRNEKELKEKRDYILSNAFKRWPRLKSYHWMWPASD